MNNGNKADFCYLCGKKIEGKTTREHIVASQFMPASLRTELNPDLLTLPAHGECNQSFMKDEEYFYSALGLHTLDLDPEVGKRIYEDLSNKFDGSKKNSGLLYKVKGQVTTSPSGLILPPGMSVQKFEKQDYDRIKRVIWKITRGCYFVSTGVFLSENIANEIQIYFVNEELPYEIKGIMTYLNQENEKLNSEKRIKPGCEFPRLFDYEFCKGEKYQCGVFMFWNSIWGISIFHNPDCVCEKCKPRY